jgi:hypothetical protein
MTEQEIEAIAQRIFDESSERTRLGRAKCVAASVIHRMGKYGEHTDPDAVLESAFRILAQQLEGWRREGY